MTVKYGKRGAALILSAVMLFGMLPVGALAADEDISVTVPDTAEVQESAAPAGEPDGADTLPPEPDRADGPEEDGDAAPVEGKQEDAEEPEVPVLLLDAEAEPLGIDLNELYTDEVFASDDEYADGMGFLRKTLNAFDVFSFGDFSSNSHIASVIAANGDVEINGDIGPYVGAESGMTHTSYIGGTLVSSMGESFSNMGAGIRRLYLNPNNNVPVSLEGNQFKYTATGERKTLVLSEDIEFGLSSAYIDFDRAAVALEDASDALTRACAGKVVTVGMVEAAIRGENPGFPEGVGYTVRAHYSGLDIQVGTAVTLEDEVLAALKKNKACLNLISDRNRTLDNTATWITVEGSKIKFDEVAYDGQQYVSNNWCSPMWFGTSMGLVWNLPQAKSVGFTGVSDYFGHVLAPDAKVTTLSGGNLDGDVICADFKGKGASCHTWGYLPGSEPEISEVPEVQTFTLDVRKYVEGAELSALDGDTFQITVEGPEDFQTVLRPVTAETGAYLSWRLEDLIPGAYTLTESGYEISGMEFDGASAAWNEAAAGEGTQLKIIVDGGEGADPVQIAAFTNRYSEPVPVMVTVVHNYGTAVVPEPAEVYSEGFVPEVKNEYQGEKYTLLRQEGPLPDQSGTLVITLYYEKYTVKKQIIVVHDYGADGSVSEDPVSYTEGFQAVPKSSFQGERYTLVKQEAPDFNAHGDIVIALRYERYVEMKNAVVVHDYGAAGTLYEDPVPYVEGFQPASKTAYNGVEYTLTGQDGPNENGNGDMIFVLRYAPVNHGGSDDNGSTDGGHTGNDREDPAPTPNPTPSEEGTVTEIPEREIADADTPLASLPENAGSETDPAGDGAGATAGEPAEDKQPDGGRLAGEQASETGTVVIAESGVPTGNLPQTGTVAQAADPTATLGLLALVSALALAGLGVLTLRKRESDQ